MTTSDFIAGDFLKNLLKNFPNEDNSFQEKEKITDNKGNAFQSQKFISSSVASQLRELKNILKCSLQKN